MFAFKVPDIGEGVVEAEVLEWRVAEGESVEEDQVLVELLTDKAEIEIPSPRAGRVHRIHFDVGDVARVGDVLIEIDDGGGAAAGSGAAGASQAEREGAGANGSAAGAAASGEKEARAAESAREDRGSRGGESGREERAPGVESDAGPRASRGDRKGDAPERAAPARPPRRPSGPPTPRPQAEGAAHAPPPMPERPRARPTPAADVVAAGTPVHTVPAVRELAKRLGVDLRAVRGTGPGGRIMRRDVEAHAEGGAAAERSTDREPSSAGRAASRAAEPAPPVQDPEDWTREPLRGLRRTIAERMSHARHTAAHFTYTDEIDVTDLLAALDCSAAAALSPLAFIAHASVRALAGFPILNASIDDARGEIITKGRIHLGIATATPQGLVVPVVRDAATLGVSALADRIRALAKGAREGTLTPRDLRGSTFTITSLGKLGGLISTPIVNHPEVAILGVNAIRLLPRVVDEKVVPRSIMNLSISVDHRITDGLVAAQYIQAVKRILEQADFEELR